MQGNPKVIEHLQRLLANELAAIDQYFIHGHMYEDWGYARLQARILHESEDERGHAALLIQRMLFLDAIPDMSQRDGLRVGRDVPEMLANDLQLEYAVVAALKEAIACCEQERDYQTRQVLLSILADTEEDHAYWLEQQLGLIDTLGLENYLQTQVHADSAPGA
ncbi:bacterioferritin [Marichromatium gracile]|uniref:Bacterioferritin n=1 Tax=Marichromatium gracile TaxID=1048 RepID=A0A4R4A9I8_MARGR|nr:MULTISPECIES: bacterioferritin [Marichromatium]MBO8085006.1 bacterioferritin [Marichromatium sp.]KXX63473.1 bacterioferritin [Marichromatium gracile]MBK1708517.1 bacterioferritin [Marichromatium gracile]MCF1183087.1 bacterioferritin [Marichromatium gracile]RNE89930.1 bacterioferritin [Marichromatium sp. AB31]